MPNNSIRSSNTCNTIKKTKLSIKIEVRVIINEDGRVVLRDDLIGWVVMSIRFRLFVSVRSCMLVRRRLMMVTLSLIVNRGLLVVLVVVFFLLVAVRFSLITMTAVPFMFVRSGLLVTAVSTTIRRLMIVFLFLITIRNRRLIAMALVFTMLILGICHSEGHDRDENQSNLYQETNVQRHETFLKSTEIQTYR